MENDAPQTSEVSKYQLISQPKLDKFQLQCYSKKWRPLVSTQQRTVCATDQQRRRRYSAAERTTRESVTRSSATRQRALGAHRLE